MPKKGRTPSKSKAARDVPIERNTPKKPRPKARKRVVKRQRITNKVLAALAEQNLMTFTAQRTSRINRRCDETGIKDKQLVVFLNSPCRETPKAVTQERAMYYKIKPKPRKKIDVGLGL